MGSLIFRRKGGTIKKRGTEAGHTKRKGELVNGRTKKGTNDRARHGAYNRQVLTGNMHLKRGMTGREEKKRGPADKAASTPEHLISYKEVSRCCSCKCETRKWGHRGNKILQEIQAP